MPQRPSPELLRASPRSQYRSRQPGGIYILVMAAQIGWELGGALPIRRPVRRPDLDTFANTLDEVASVLQLAQRDIRASEAELRKNEHLISLSHEQADAVRKAITTDLDRGHRIDRWIGVIGIAVGITGVAIAFLLAP